MTAAPPGSWDGAGVRSLEMRWIFPGRRPAAMAGWFGRLPAQTTVIEDAYLVDPHLPGLSVKVRGGRALEIKAYRGSPGPLEVAGHPRGRLEYWLKWSSRIRNLTSSKPLAEAEGKVAGLLHGPLAHRRARGDPADVHPAGAMFDEHQDIQSPEEHGVHVQEIDCDDPGGLGVQELPPARARAPRCWIDACSMQDLPPGGRRDCHAELGQFAMD